MESDQEIATYLTVAAIEWLQEQQDVQLQRDAASIGASVGALYKAILKQIASTETK